MASLLANSVRRKIAVGSKTGQGVVCLGDRIDGNDVDAFDSPRCAMVSGSAYTGTFRSKPATGID